MEDAEPPEAVPYLEISKEISPLAARDYLQARDEVMPFITSLPPFRAQGNTAFCTTTQRKKVCICSALCTYLPMLTHYESYIISIHATYSINYIFSSKMSMTLISHCNHTVLYS